MLLPAGVALLVAVVATVAGLGELLTAARAPRPLRAPYLAASATVGAFALATAALLGWSATSALGRPSRYATLPPEPALRPETLLLAAGVAALAGGLVRADRTARLSERSGGEVARAVRVTNVVLVLAGVGLVVLGVVVLAL